MRYADRMGQLGTETAFEVLAKARALEAKGRSIVHLEIGEPDFDTPAAIREAAVRALSEGFTHYGPSAGLPEVRETIARLKVPLVQSGGVDLSVFTSEDQLALSPMLDLWIYSRSDRWVYLLVGEGLEQVERVPPRGWSVGRDEFTGAPELVAAVEKTAERLTLRLV